MSGMGIDDFLKHSNRGGKRKFLKGWRNAEPYAINVFLHPQASILALWRHPWQRVNVSEDRETKQVTRAVWVERLVCWEDEETLQHQHWRDKETGRREHPPQVCPHCLMTEFVRDLVDAGKLSWVEPIFRFSGDDPKDTRWYHAGGLYNAFGAKDLGKDEKEEMANVPASKGGPIYAKNAWAENTMAKLEYCFTIVNPDDVPAGIQVTIESNLLGEKVKETIAKRIKSAGREKGNPLVTPYAIRWEYNPKDGIPFNQKYDALMMEQIPVTPAIAALFREPPPDVAPVATRFDLKTHRAMLERHCVLPNPKTALPWDDFFREALRRAPKGESQAQVPEEVSALDALPARGERNPGSAPALAARPAAPPPPPADEMFACDGCEKPMKASDPKCPHCGMVYEVEAAPPPPPPKLPKRSEAKARAAAAPAAPSAASEAEKRLGVDPGDPPDACGGEDDDIPF